MLEVKGTNTVFYQITPGVTIRIFCLYARKLNRAPFNVVPKTSQIVSLTF